jgi:hypothetical protein
MAKHSSLIWTVGKHTLPDVGMLRSGGISTDHATVPQRTFPETIRLRQSNGLRRTKRRTILPSASATSSRRILNWGQVAILWARRPPKITIQLCAALRGSVKDRALTSHQWTHTGRMRCAAPRLNARLRLNVTQFLGRIVALTPPFLHHKVTYLVFIMTWVVSCEPKAPRGLDPNTVLTSQRSRKQYGL